MPWRAKILRLPVQGEMVGIFADQHMRQYRLARHAAVDWTLPGGRLDQGSPPRCPARDRSAKETADVGIGHLLLFREISDRFARPGSTLVACEKSGRQARLVELDPKYVDTIILRCQEFSGGTATLDGDGRRYKEIAAGLEAAAA